MTVSVRDELSRQPVAGAVVHARTVHFFVPSSYMFAGDVPLMGRDPVFDPSPPRSARGITAHDGTVRLEVILDHPVQIIVIAAGYEPQAVDLLERPADTGESRWLEVRLIR